LLNDPIHHTKSTLPYPIVDLPASATVLGPAIEDLLLQCCVERIQWLRSRQLVIQQRQVGSPALTLQETFESYWHYWARFADQFYALVASRYISVLKLLTVLRSQQITKDNAILYLISQALCTSAFV